MSETATIEKPKAKFILQFLEEFTLSWVSLREFDTLQDAEEAMYSNKSNEHLQILAQRIVKQTVCMYCNKDETIVYWHN